MLLKGKGVSGGTAFGRAAVLCDEKEKLKKATAEFAEKTKRIIKGINNKKEAEIFECHIMLLSDPVFLTEVNEKIDAGKTALQAAKEALDGLYGRFYYSENATLKSRAADMTDIKARLLEILKETDFSGTVVVVKEITPSLIIKLKKSGAAAVVSENGSVLSHSALLARSMELPAVFAVENATKSVSEGEMLFVDGCSGTVSTSPAEIKNAPALPLRIIKERSGVKVLGNISSADEAKLVAEYGGDGIGLFRTEFLFCENEPSEEEQLNVYSFAAKAMQGKETVIRTADFGGDKSFSCQKTDLRGIRFSLKKIPLFKSQLRAILRSAVYGSVKILLPFVSTTEEVEQTKALINACIAELEDGGLEYKKAPLGVMIETPSAALISDLLAKEAEFFSIGTNDLAASVMAADRFGENSPELCSVFQPAVLKAVEMTLKNANGIPVTVCGEAAADERFIDFLKERGVDALSVSPPLIPKTKGRL